jgi:lysophospholipase L1-like esterase
VPRLVTLALVALALLGAIAPPAAEFAATGSTAAAAAPTGPSAPAPSSMDALGDSFTRGLYSGGCGTSATCANNSWSTGTTVGLQSHYQRLVALNPALSGHAINRAVSGRKMDYLDTEAKAAIADAPAYVTIMMGLNDVCGGSLTPSTMTAPSVVGSQFRTAMSDLTSHLPAVRVFVASIPNPYTLWQILHTNTSATSAWNAQQVCPTMLKNPTSTAPADVSRRATVRQRVVDDNAQIQQVCSQFTQCRFDTNAVYNWPLAPSDVNTGDYFHPSLQGQADLAAITYQAGYNFGAPTAQPKISSFSPTSGAAGTTSVKIAGANLTGATAVKFNGSPASFHVDSGTQITATVPKGATTGTIAVTTSSGTVTSASKFTVTFTVSAFSPSCGPRGTVVTVDGAGFTNPSTVKFNGTSASATIFVSSSRLRATVPTGATSGPISVTRTTSPTTSSSARSYSVTAFTPPSISGFTPSSGPTGTLVSVNGSALCGASSVTFNGKAASFPISSSSQIKATVPHGATSGRIRVTTPAGTATSPSNFTVTFSITSFSPTSGAAGTTVSISGVGFNSSSSVKFNGVSASKTLVSPTQLKAVVPAAATTGKISVTNSTAPTGTVSSASSFTKT